MKKAFDQISRDIKRGVNKKVLKVPSIEQKVLDATSNEPWGPHGTHLADIAQASRNYHEYQMIMSVVWKRINDTGKNWRHVYKGLTVLEYLVANGSERVIDDIREHAYQITALSGFQYIDSTGRDQGSNVRKKSQMLVALVNDKEMIQEVREKAAASREKFRTSGGGMNDDRYGGRDEDRNGYGREKEWGDERYGRDGGRYSEDGYKDDEYRGRSRSVDGDDGPRSRSSDRERGFEDDGRHSSRESNSRAEDEPKLPAQNLGAPPTYEDAVGEGPIPVDSKRDGETATAFVSKPSSPPPQETVVSIAAAAPTPPPAAATPPPAAVNFNQEDGGFDFFDPRGASPAAPPAAAPAAALAPAPGGVEIDLFGSLSDSFSSDALALVPSTSTTSEPHAPPSSNSGQTFMAASAVSSQPFDDPFGDGPFRAVPSTDGYPAQLSSSPFGDPAQLSSSPFGDPAPPSSSPFGDPAQPSSSPFGEPPSSAVSMSANNSGFGDAYDPSLDILADILPPTGPPQQQTAFQAQPDQLSTQTIFSSQTVQHSPQTGYAPPQASQPSSQTAFPPQPNQTTFPPSFPGQFGQPSFPSQGGGQPSFPSQDGGQPSFPSQGGGQPSFSSQGGSQPSFPSQGGGQPSFPSQGGGQPSFPSQGGGGPSMPHHGFQPAFSPQGGNQPMPQSGFPAQGGNQSGLQPGFPAQGGNQSMPQSSFLAQGGQLMPQPAFPPQGGNQPMPQPSFGQSVLQPGFPAQGGNQPMPHSAQGGQSMPQPGYTAQGGQSASMISGFSQAGFPSSNGHSVQPNNFHGGFQPQGSSASNFYQQQQPQQQPQSALTGSTGALAIVPQQAANEKFETKSTVWADTLNRGLVNLNISGSKTNPLSDIGIDFEAINRKEKRLEKPSKTPVTSNVTMGKAMGSGSGIGRAGAGILRPAPNPMMGPGMGATMGAPGARPGFAPGYGQQPMGMNMQQNMGGIGMNMGQGFQMQQGYPPGSAMPANYNPMMGRGAGYGQQQQYGGYR